MKSYTYFLVNIQNETAYVVVNREEKLNALNSNILLEFSALLDDLAINTEVRGVIITGAGAKAFVAGADIVEFKGMSALEASTMAAQGQVQVMDKIANFGKPIIAAINGFALGGGLEIAMACHLRVASSNAKLGLPEVSLGVIPGYGGTQRLTQLVGRGKALEMIMTADIISADEALQWGLVNHVVDQESLIVKCEAIMQKIYSRSRTAVAFAIVAVNEGLINPDAGYQKEIALFGESFSTADAKEGIQAFIEKRKPNY